ncbi:SUMO ligase siz1 [Orbilia brochopaga]|uniref:SUMO ligase siz1 n=1 Tax=Orbilia brochopaga TaxID=3140254 RepID=A0AAV9UVR8_9PEZI
MEALFGLRSDLNLKRDLLCSILIPTSSPSTLPPSTPTPTSVDPSTLFLPPPVASEIFACQRHDNIQPRPNIAAAPSPLQSRRTTSRPTNTCTSPMTGDTDSRWVQQRAALVKYVQQKLLVRHLQTILKKLALPVSGLKVAQQARLIDQIDKVIDAKNDEGLQQLKRLIYTPDSTEPLSPSHSPNAASPRLQGPKAATFSSPQYSSPGVYHTPLLSPNPPAMSPGANLLNFFHSPFYDPRQNLVVPHTLPQMSGTNPGSQRSVVHISVVMTQQVCDEVRKNGLRLILYCAAIEGGNVVGPHHVAFPQQIEIRVNSKTVTANLRGLKNKPGTTRPLDVTDYFEKLVGFKNTLTITYALSTRKYLAVVKLVKKSSPEDLVGQIKQRPHISKKSVLDRLQKESEDDDIVATSSIMSLKCPASTLRIDTPIRSINCKHHQCYDAVSFLQLQEQAPTWTCPVCSRKIEFEHLAVDKYVEEILNSVPKSVESVMIDPMGKWTVPERKSSSPRVKRDYDYDSEDSEDEISILDSAPSSFRTSTNAHPPPLVGNLHNHAQVSRNPFSTPKSLSSEPLAVPPSSTRPNSTVRASGGSNKRKAPVTIDLTLSDDEDEVRLPPPKRHQTSATPTPSNSFTYTQRPPNGAGASPGNPFTLSWSNGYDY